MVEPADACAYRLLTGHVIVCGLRALGLRIVEVLRSSAVPVVVIDDDPDPRLLSILGRWDVPHMAEMPRMPEVLINAGLYGARAVVAVGAGDLQNLETALVVRNLRPDVRIILQMANAAVGAAVGDLVTSGAALDVASLAAPSLVQACLGRGQLDLDLEGERFEVTETLVTRPGTLRSIFGDLVPIGVVEAGANAVEICPGRDHPVQPGDRVSVLGTGEELADALGGMRATIAPSPARPSQLSTALQAVRSVAQGAGRRIGMLMLALIGLVAISTLILRLGYHTGRGGRLPTLDSLYFTVETISTVGYGDFSFAAQSTWLRVFGIVLIILGATAITALFALITDLLLSRRVTEAFGLGRVTRMRGHVVVVGLGAVGLRVVEELVRYGLNVVVIESDEQNRHLSNGRALRIPIIVGDATRTETLDAANVAAASAVAILTSDDLTNLETGLSLRQHMRTAGREVPTIMRIFDRPLGRVIEDSFGFGLVRSTSALAAPWFVGAALGLDILSTFYIEQELLLVAGLTVAPGGGLAGLAMQDLSARIRVIALRRSGASVLEHPPRRNTRFAPGDRAFLIGPYEELRAFSNAMPCREPRRPPANRPPRTPTVARRPGYSRTMETWDAIRSRRNVRTYEVRPLPEDALTRILEAGRRAPSASNRQAWDFVVVTDAAQLRELSTVWRGAGHIAGSACTVALVLGQPEAERYLLMDQYDLGQATMAMMLAATDLGIGTGHSAVGDQDACRRILGLPDDHHCAYLLGLGYPAGQPLSPIVTPDRRPLPEVVHRDRW